MKVRCIEACVGFAIVLMRRCNGSSIGMPLDKGQRVRAPVRQRRDCGVSFAIARMARWLRSSAAKREKAGGPSLCMAYVRLLRGCRRASLAGFQIWSFIAFSSDASAKTLVAVPMTIVDRENGGFCCARSKVTGPIRTMQRFPSWEGHSFIKTHGMKPT